MSTATSPATETIGHELVITRTIDAPCSLVFNAWTDPRHMAQWWGPHGFTNPVCELDVRPGGAIRIVMRAPDGTDYPMTGVFHEIKEPERLVITTAVDDKDGQPNPGGAHQRCVRRDRRQDDAHPPDTRHQVNRSGRRDACRDESRLDAEPRTPRAIRRKGVTMRIECIDWAGVGRVAVKA